MPTFFRRRTPGFIRPRKKENLHVGNHGRHQSSHSQTQAPSSMGDPTRRTIRLDDLIFKATDGLLIGPDYAAIMYTQHSVPCDLLQNLLTHPQLHQQRQICDVLNNRKERVPLAVGVFKERLKHREKDVVLRTLEVPTALPRRACVGSEVGAHGGVWCATYAPCRAVARRRYQERSRKVAWPSRSSPPPTNLRPGCQ